ncbi:MAG TPA: rhomboid family intramembrane serine protease [Chromatiales bacterium]|nr:rhomboid family intramembrane serine protease [Chromatiales bacterium]
MIPLHDDNPTTLRPVVTVALIAACVAAFLWQLSLGQDGYRRAVYSLGFIPAVFFGERVLAPELAVVPPALTLVTSMFLHGGLWHLLGNMLYLWIFGNNVEDAMGHARFVAFYLLCGIAAALGQGILDPGSTIPMIGASGAISGVLGAYLLLYPHARVLVLIPLGFFSQLVRVPAVLVLGLWFLIQIVSSLAADPSRGGVAWFAHIGGFLAGMALIPFFKRRDVPLHNPLRAPRRLR